MAAADDDEPGVFVGPGDHALLRAYPNEAGAQVRQNARPVYIDTGRYMDMDMVMAGDTSDDDDDNDANAPQNSDDDDDDDDGYYDVNGYPIPRGTTRTTASTTTAVAVTGDDSDLATSSLRDAFAGLCEDDRRYLARSGVDFAALFPSRPYAGQPRDRPDSPTRDPHKLGDTLDAVMPDDSDEEEAKASKQPPDLYGDELDDEDEAWVKKNLTHGSQPSDATLCCPLCFTILCYESQRHERYKQQYRAIFVKHCKVNTATKLVSADEPDGVYEVTCEVCGAQVGVQDMQQVYHFFHVLPSNERG